MRDVYRSAACVLLLKPSDVCSPDGCGTVYQILLLHKPRKKDAWQLPQGGVEAGETVEQGALRELREEAGITGVQVLGASSDTYRYDFPSSFRSFRPDHVCGQNIHCIFGTVSGNTAVKVDGREIDDFAWVYPEQLPLTVKRKHYLEFILKMLSQAMEKIGAPNV